MTKRNDTALALMNASLLAYLFWLLLPAVQTTGRAAAGAATVALFGAGVLCDFAFLKQHWLRTVLRALCALAAPLFIRLVMGRGGDNAAGFYVQQVMFWFPLVYAGYAADRADARMWRWVRTLLLCVVTLTTLTTIGWLVQGMLRGGRVYAYSRSLGYAGEGREAYLKELMLRNIGGYDFIYASVASLPMTIVGMQRSRGWARVGYSALLCAQTVMIVLSQYTYAMLFAAAILAVECVAAVVRRASRGRVGMGASLAWGCLPIAVLLLLMQPLATLAASVCTQLGLANFARSFELLLEALGGGALAQDSRMAYYRLALDGFAASPLWGDLAGGAKQLSLHSDVLDLLSGGGLIGAALLGGMVWLMGRGSLKGLAACPHRAQLCVMAAAVFATALLGTVVYSRDVMAVACVGAALVLRPSAQNT